jgi:hypothetical protein
MTSAICDILLPGGDPGAAYSLADDVVLAIVDDGSSRLLDLGGHFFGLPAGSTELLVATLRHGPGPAAVQVARRTGAPLERVRADLAAFLADLQGRGLLVPAARSRRRGAVRRLVDGALAATLKGLRLGLRPFGRTWALLGLAYLSLRLFGWARTADLWERLARRGSAPDDALARAEQIDREVREAAARHLLAVDCKERALVCWALLREAGVPARLVVGIDLYPFLGHCWCEAEGRVVSDDPERCFRFVPVLSRS